jgi:hypothetical protein
VFLYLFGEKSKFWNKRWINVGIVISSNARPSKWEIQYKKVALPIQPPIIKMVLEVVPVDPRLRERPTSFHPVG